MKLFVASSFSRLFPNAAQNTKTRDNTQNFTLIKLIFHRQIQIESSTDIKVKLKLVNVVEALEELQEGIKLSGEIHGKIKILANRRLVVTLCPT